jgi:acyl-coenzyme A synthetase/AMP-(fatty) acid ligase
LDSIAEDLSKMAEVPALLLWGPSDPVFSDRYLRDLEARLPHADVHRFVGAGHLVFEDVDVTKPILEWVSSIGSGAPHTVDDDERPSLWDAIDQHRGDDSIAVIEMQGDQKARSISHAELATDVGRVAAGFEASGISRGDRVALLIPPGIDLTVCVYACWRLGAVVVIADAGLGPRGMTKALQSAAPQFIIGVAKAMVAARTLRWPGRRISVERLSATSRRALGVGADLAEIRQRGAGRAVPLPPSDDDLAAVVFTSGATGPAKGVAYRHHQAQAQRDALMKLYGIRDDDRLVAAFAPFALYGPAMGIPSVVPDMDVTSPGTLTAAALAGAVAALDATMVFASPAALANVAATADDLSPTMRAALEGVRLLMSAGAPVSASLLRRVAELVPNAELHTPYGMTEVLPVADISLTDIEAVGSGNGVCVGIPVDGVDVAISPLPGDGRSAGDLSREHSVVGEVCIRAPHSKDKYDKLWATQRASAEPGGWHRSGDVGHFDDAGRLWIEGRRIHLITGPEGLVTPVGIEHAAETVRGVARAAAVGVGPTGTQQVVVVVALDDPVRMPSLADDELADRIRDAVPVDVAAVLTVSSLPVDKRHNSKIDRTKVAAWASKVLAGQRIGQL